jgi:soluble lytic murein transglycosylase-like protein
MKGLILFKLISAMIIVESNGNPNAYNPQEEAVGVLQIRPIMVAELNRLGIEFCLDDRYSKTESVNAFKQWIKIKNYTDPEIIARKWNGGPNGHLKASTLKYWIKVRNLIYPKYHKCNLK